MTAHPLLAIIDAPIIIGILVVGALLFGADKLPKLARSAGQAKKEFVMGQAEADEAVAKAREEARQRNADAARRHHGQRRGRLDVGRSHTAADAGPWHAKVRKLVTAGAATRAANATRRRGIKRRCRSRSTCGSSVTVF